MSDTKRSCEFCDKRGLPVMPVRYALAEMAGRVPRLTAPMSVDAKFALPDSTKAQYTARLLRSGYLYVYDEARKRWEGYFVTDGGYYLKFPIQQPMSPALAKTRQPCTDEGHQEIASCVTIPDPKHATHVWFAFSDVEWTPAVLKKHADAAYRKRHMQVLDVKAWLSKKQHPQAKPIETLRDTVAEYTRLMTPYKNIFGSSPFKFHNRQEKSDNLIKNAAMLAPHGVILGIPDPAGVAQELAALMVWRQANFMAQPERKYRVTIGGVIAQMEAAIKDEAQRQEQVDAKIRADHTAAQMGFGLAFSSKAQKTIEDMRNPTAAQLERVADEEWKKYTAKYSEVERTQWHSTFQEEFKKFDTQRLVPLVQAHVAWMRSAMLADYFECDFDPNDTENGLVYTTVLANCIAGTSDKKACADLYTEWFLGELDDQKNLLLHGLTLNQTLLKKEILGAATNSVSWGGLAWDKVIEAFDKATQKLNNGHPDALGRLVGLVSGPVANALRKGAQSNRVYAGLVAVGAAVRQPIVLVEVEGGKKAFRAILIKELLRQSGTFLNPKQIQKAVASELKRLEILGIKLEGTDKKRWLLMIDPAEVANMPKDLSPTARAQWLAKAIRTPEDVEAMNLYKFRMKADRLVNQAYSGTRYVTPMGFAFLGIIANAVAMQSVLGEEASAMQHVKSESVRRVYAQGMQLIGASAAAIETGLEMFVMPVLKVGRGVSDVVARFAGRLGRSLGIIGSLLMGIWDIWRANVERSEGNYAAMGAYLASGILGIAATVLLAIGWTGWGLIAVIALIAWSFIMGYLIDNKLQDWLERCVWGKLVEKRYNNLELELSELKVATGA